MIPDREYYEFIEEPENFELRNEELEEKQARAVELLEELIPAVYESGCILTIENILDELAGVFDLVLPISPPAIEEKK